MDTVRDRLQDIMLAVSWKHIANRYFQQKSSWIYSKMHAPEGSSSGEGFTDEEKSVLRNALLDLAERIRKAAQNI